MVFREDEHQLIAQYCQSLNGRIADSSIPRSPVQVMAAIDQEQREELEAMIRLLSNYNSLDFFVAPKGGKRLILLHFVYCRELEEENATLQAEYERLRSKQTPGSTPDEMSGNDMIAEAKLLREHKGRLEARMRILEDHNRQLEAKLERLRQLLDEVSYFYYDLRRSDFVVY